VSIAQPCLLIGDGLHLCRCPGGTGAKATAATKKTTTDLLRLAKEPATYGRLAEESPAALLRLGAEHAPTSGWLAEKSTA